MTSLMMEDSGEFNIKIREYKTKLSFLKPQIIWEKTHNRAPKYEQYKKKSIYGYVEHQDTQ